MHEMQAIAIDDPRHHLSCGFTRLRCANTVEQIKVLFVVKTFGDPRNETRDTELLISPWIRCGLRQITFAC